MFSIVIVFLPFVLAIISYLIGRKSELARDRFTVIATAIELALVLVLFVLTFNGTAAQTGIGNFKISNILAYGISFKTDGFRASYALVTAFMWFMTTLFSREYFLHERENLNRYFMFVLMTLGATEGVMLSGDIMTAYFCFEILSFTSFTWVIHEETHGAVRAAYTYLFIAVIGGLVLFMGLALLQNTAGTLAFSELGPALKALGKEDEPAVMAAGICILLGFGAKAGIFPVHIWLPKAHPVAPSPASALLSGVLTKVGVYGILMTTLEIFLENEKYGWIVLTLGTITMFLGAFLALFSVNLKRTLALSSMSQIGFIMVGTAMTVLLSCAGAEEGAMETLAGTYLHMVNHSMLKLCLFCAAGTVVMNIHALDLDTIRGWGRNKTLLKIAFFLGYIGISGVPMFNGYASKTLLHEGIVMGAEAFEQYESILKAIEWIFLTSGGFTFAYMSKLFICVFVEKNKDPQRQAKYDANRHAMNPGSTVAVFGTSILFILLGQKPIFNALTSFMTGEANVLHHYKPLSWACVSGGLISLGIGAAVYIFFIRGVTLKNGSYRNLWPAKLDLEDLIYRPALLKWLPGIGGAFASLLGLNKISGPLSKAVLKLGQALARLFGENRVLAPLSRAVLLIGEFVGRVLVTGPDAFIMLMRRTVVSEMKVEGKEETRADRMKVRAEVVRGIASPIFANFSFSLMMSCIGIIAILVVTLIVALH
ncbi:MAG: complex I subunit 5 family protein [Lachnospiraceae bacterium]|nr:complex I subunit 5 family protein [Lachnospiraceae bacterium]